MVDVVQVARRWPAEPGPQKPLRLEAQSEANLAEPSGGLGPGRRDIRQRDHVPLVVEPRDGRIAWGLEARGDEPILGDDVEKGQVAPLAEQVMDEGGQKDGLDRKSTRLNSRP